MGYIIRANLRINIFHKPIFVSPYNLRKSVNMKRYLLLLCLLGLSVSGCNVDKAATRKQDSLSADAAADSMLKEALKSDSAKVDPDSL